MKAKLKLHKLLSLLLTLVMVVGLLPAMGQVAYAYSAGDIAGTTGSGASEADPVVCDTFAEFKAAMESSEITYVKLEGARETIPERDSYGAAIEQKSPKTLIVEGRNALVSPLNGNIGCLLYVNSELNVKGSGTLEYSHGMTAGFGAVIYVASTNSLTIQDVTLVGKANGSTFGRALYLERGSKTKILSGTFSGYSASTAYDTVSAVFVDGSAELTIEDGFFYATAYAAYADRIKTYGLVNYSSTTKVTLNGGTYDGIDASNANCNLSDMLGTNRCYTDSNGTVDMTSVTNTTERLTVEPKRIYAVDVTITEPVAGAHPQDAVSNTANVSVGMTEWYHNGTKMSASDTFAAGETYRVYVIVYPDSGYEFADNPTATFNGFKTGTLHTNRKDFINYYAEFTPENDIINSVDVKITEPVAGAHPQDAVSNTAGVSVVETEWQCDGIMSASDAFEAGKTYRVWVYVEPASGYAFADNVTLTFNGSKEGKLISSGNGQLTYVADFTASGAPTTTTIDTVNVTLTEPVAGAHPQDAVSNTAGVSVVETEWQCDGIMSASDAFEAGKTYRVWVYVEPASGYAFADNVTLTFNGSKEGKLISSGNGQLTYVADFTASGAPTEYGITVTDGKATVGAGTEITKAAEGTTVTLTANAAPADKVFDKWEVVSGSITLADATSETTTFTMPASAVSVKATYKDAPHTHTFDQEIIKDAALKTAADCTHDAVYYKSCSCGAISTDDADTFTAINSALGHAWPEEGSWSKDTDKHWYECSRCHLKKDEAAHDYGDDDICDICTYDNSVPHTHNLTLVDENPATCTTPGNKAYYTCDGCDKWFEDATGSVEITDKTSVILTANGHTPSDWKFDADNHWKECTVVGCGVIIEDSKAAHTASDWIIDTEATATTDGTKHKECTECGYVMETGTIPATGSGEHTHSYGSEWKTDADKHWHECSCGAKAEEAAHTASKWITDTAATATTDGTKHKECTVCHRVLETGTIPATGGGEHMHNYSSDWKSDSINHWKECSCGHKDDVAAHSFKWVVDKEATATKKGTKHEECKVCGYQRPAVEIPATGSTTKPNNPTESNPNTGALDDVPQTGDNSNMILWIVLLLASGLGVTGTVVYSKRKKYVK